MQEEALRLAAADAAAPRKEYVFAPPGAALRRRLVESLLQDPRDEPALWLLLNVSTTSLPVAAALLAMRCSSHVLCGAYLVATYVTYLQRFMLTLHFAQHRRLFKRRECCCIHSLRPKKHTLATTPSL